MLMGSDVTSFSLFGSDSYFLMNTVMFYTSSSMYLKDKFPNNVQIQQQNETTGMLLYTTTSKCVTWARRLYSCCVAEMGRGELM
jgi:hypothetical protein